MCAGPEFGTAGPERLRKAARGRRPGSAPTCCRGARLSSETSAPFDGPRSGKTAVKVINHYGDEVLKVYHVRELLKGKRPAPSIGSR